MIMKKILYTILLLVTSAMLSAQTPSSRYEQRYDLLVSQFGPAGVGVETVLNNWEKVDSTNARMLQGRFAYFFTKAQTGVVESRPGKKYLGMDPVITLKDSLGNDVNYFEINVFDDELYAEALKVADRAVSIWPDMLDFRFMKTNAYIAYEKESPDMALASLMQLADENLKRKSSWEYNGEKVGQQFFQEAMQEYCFSFYTLGTQPGYEAFRQLSEKLSVMFPDNTEFVNNIGSYYLIAKEDYKTAYKYYNKVLKAHPDDMTAIRNGLVAARKQKNLKQEKKYLEMMVRYGSERDRLQAEGRLKSMKK
jgi:tetratricopeptide (TPR) repeat protein